MKKLLNIALVLLLILLTVLPAPMAEASPATMNTKGDTAAAWPAVFSPYTKADGSVIYDPAGDEHPIDIDITSGVDRGAGKLPSMYVASDGANLFVRLRVKGNPYDRKGGFLSSVWLVQLAVNGEHKATVGLNGKSPSTDYVYVANADGTSVQPIYKTTSAGNAVEGTKISSAENGQYFLDFQVPIARITEVVPDITSVTPVQYFFGTSKAANLSVINKEFMDTESNNGQSVDFSGLANLKVSEQPLSVTIDGGASKQYNLTESVKGKASVSTGTVLLKINGKSVEVPVSGYSWSSAALSTFVSSNGTYQAIANLQKDGKEATAAQEIVAVGQTSDTITIDGGTNVTTTSKTPVLSGTYSSSLTNGNSGRITISIDNGPAAEAVKSNDRTWSYTLTNGLPGAVNGKEYLITAKLTSANGNTVYATTTQKLIYKDGALVSVGISEVTANAARPVIKGTYAGAKEIELKIDGTTVEVVKSLQNGVWEVAALEKPLAAGSHTITAIASTEQGNTATASKLHTVGETSITIDNGSTVTINDNQPTLRGNTNAPDGSDVYVLIEGPDHYYKTVKAQNGRWMVEVLDAVLMDGIYDVAVEVITPDGQSAYTTQQLTIDTRTAVAITKPADKASLTETKPLLSGTAEKEATVELIVRDAAGKINYIENAAASSEDGNWQSAPVNELALGTYTLTATAADPYGNEAVAAHTFTVAAPSVTIKSAAPSLATVDYGTSLASAKAALGTETNVTLVNGETKTVDVVWDEQQTNSYNGTVTGDYKFIGTLTNLPADLNNQDDVTAEGTVTVGPQPTVSIDKAEKVLSVPYGTSISEVKSKLGTSVTAVIGERSEEIQVTWNENSSPVYNSALPGEYTFQGTFGELPSGTDNKNGVVPVAKITIEQKTTASINSVTDVEVTVPYGTSKETAKESLKNEVTVTLENGEEGKVPITWSSDSSPAYDGSIADTYIFTGTFGEMPAGIDNDKEITAPAGKVTVQQKKPDVITSISPIEETVEYGTVLADAKTKLGGTITVTLESGEPVSFPVTWSTDSVPTYNSKNAGTYEFTGQLTLPDDIVMGENAADPKGTVTVLPQATKSIQSVVTPIEKAVKIGATAEAAKSKLGLTVKALLEDGSYTDIPVTWSADSLPAYEAEQAGLYEFTAAFGSLPAGVDNEDKVPAPIGLIRILDNKADIESYSFTQQTKLAEIDRETGTINVEVEYGTDLEKLIASFTTSLHVTDITIGETSQTSGSTLNDFTSPKVYTVTAEDGTEKEWTVTVTVQGKTETPLVGTVRAKDNHISGMSEPNAVIVIKRGTEIIGQTTADSSGKWMVGLTESVTLAEGEKLNVTAEVPGEVVSKEKEVTVQRALSSEKQLLSTEYGTLGTQSTVLKVPEGTKVSDFKAGLTVSPYANAEIVGDKGAVSSQETTAVTSKMQIRVTAEDGSNAFYTISILRNVKLELHADPVSVIGDGVSKAELKASLKDSEGNPISGAEVDFTAELGTLSAAKAVTNKEGEATVVLTSPKIEGTATVSKKVKASVEDALNGIFAEADITIKFQPPIIEGEVLNSDGTPIAGAKVWVLVGNEKIETITDSNGGYTLTVPQAGTYTVNIEATTKVSGKDVTSSFTQKAEVQAGGQGEVFKSERTVSGQLFLGTRNNGTKTLFEMFPNAKPLIRVLNDTENNVTATVDSEGQYKLTGFEAGKTYQVVFNLEIDGELFAGKAIDVTVNDEGQMIIQNELIDPFGLITDTTSNLLAGVTMKLYWADTPLNRENGRIPGELVALPELAAFLPNENKNPQTSTGWLEHTAETGNYAWMVYANADYYIIGEKNGYVTYDSRKDLLTDDKSGDSWIHNGIIHIGNTIMRYDFSMNAITQPSLPAPAVSIKQAPAITKEVSHGTSLEEAKKALGKATAVTLTDGKTKMVNVTWSQSPASSYNGNKEGVYTFKGTFTSLPAGVDNKNNVQAAGTVTVLAEPTPVIIPKVTIAAPAENQLFIDELPAFAGKTNPNHEVALYLNEEWIGTATSDADGNWTFKLPAEIEEGSYTLYAAVEDSEGTALVSDETNFDYAESKKHIQYIHGYLDGEFKPTLPVTRAQMAAMLSRNLTDNKVPKAQKLTYGDTKSSWAKADIEYARTAGIMFGFTNKQFGPSSEVTRAQMAAIAVRWIEKQCTEDPEHASYCSTDEQAAVYKDVTKKHWAAREIERISDTGIMEGYNDSTFRPDEKLTRAQAVKVLNRLFQRGPLEGVTVPAFKDIPKDHWAYKEVEEAAKDHSYIIKDGKETLYKH